MALEIDLVLRFYDPDAPDTLVGEVTRSLVLEYTREEQVNTRDVP